MSPLVDYDHNATWWLLYHAQLGGTQVTYGRAWLLGTREKKYAHRAMWLDAILPPGPGLVVGAAFGFLLENLVDVGRADVWGTDTSTWIHQHIDTEGLASIRPKVVAKDVQDADAAEWFAARTGRPFSWVLTEEVLSAYDDGEARGLAESCERFVPASSVFHIVNTGGQARPPFNSHTLDEWAALAPTHRWLDTRGKEAGS